MLPRARMLVCLGFFVSVILMSGCAEFAERRFRRPEEPPPERTPLERTPPLQIPGAPNVAAKDQPERKQPPVIPAKGEASTAETLRAIYQRAHAQHQTMPSYMMRLKRREVVNGKPRPEELVLVKFRQEPFSVYFKWIGPEAKGREVVYVKGQQRNEIHTLTAAGDVILLPAGARFSVSADSSLVKSKSRYPITEAGLGSSIRKFGSLALAIEKGDTRQGTVKYLGEVKRPEFDEPVLGVEQTLPRDSDPLLSGGGRRWWYFDIALCLPVLIITNDETGREVEYYCHDRIQTPVRLDDDDFNPDKLWPKKTQ